VSNDINLFFEKIIQPVLIIKKKRIEACLLKLLYGEQQEERLKVMSIVF
jgi:hypothetical protein